MTSHAPDSDHPTDTAPVAGHAHDTEHETSATPTRRDDPPPAPGRFWKNTGLLVTGGAIATTATAILALPPSCEELSSQISATPLPEAEMSTLDDIKTEKALKFLNGMIEAVSRPDISGGNRAGQSFRNLDEFINHKFREIFGKDGETFRVIYENADLPHLPPRGTDEPKYDIEYAVSTDGRTITITYRSDFPGADGDVFSGQIEIKKTGDEVYVTVDGRELGPVSLEELIRIVRTAVPGGNAQAYYQRKGDFSTPIEEGEYASFVV